VINLGCSNASIFLDIYSDKSFMCTTSCLVLFTSLNRKIRPARHTTAATIIMVSRLTGIIVEYTRFIFLSNYTHLSLLGACRAFIWAMRELNGFVMRGLTTFVCGWGWVPDKSFECPGSRIVRQYKNDGEESDDFPIHCLLFS
jgi:hypothetical protein